MVALAVIAGGLAGILCQWVFPPISLKVTISLLCVVVGFVNLKPDFDIPNRFTLFGLTFGFIRPLQELPVALQGFLVCGLLFLFIELFGQMGRGCTKWAAVLGLLLGLPLGLLGCFLAFMLGAIFGLFQILLKKADSKTLFPFGCFQSLAGLILVWVGPSLNWLWS
jgi:prepilin signal peptidase PulO-like enzyme (type II secretory pathway)